MMRLAAIILMLSAFACLIPIPALCDTTTYTCQYQSYSDKKGNHKMAELQTRLHRRYREGDRQNRRQQGKFQCRDAVFPERGHDVHRDDRRGQGLDDHHRPFREIRPQPQHHRRGRDSSVSVLRNLLEKISNDVTQGLWTIALPSYAALFIAR